MAVTLHSSPTLCTAVLRLLVHFYLEEISASDVAKKCYRLSDSGTSICGNGRVNMKDDMLTTGNLELRTHNLKFL